MLVLRSLQPLALPPGKWSARHLTLKTFRDCRCHLSLDTQVPVWPCTGGIYMPPLWPGCLLAATLVSRPVRHWLPDPLGAPHHLDHSGRCQGHAHIFCGVSLDSPQGYSMRVRPPLSAVSQSRCPSKLANLLSQASEHLLFCRPFCRSAVSSPICSALSRTPLLLYQAVPLPPAEQIACGKSCTRTQGSCSA